MKRDDAQRDKHPGSSDDGDRADIGDHSPLPKRPKDTIVSQPTSQPIRRPIIVMPLIPKPIPPPQPRLLPLPSPPPSQPSVVNIEDTTTTTTTTTTVTTVLTTTPGVPPKHTITEADLDPIQKRVYHHITRLHANVMITGSAGCGKTALLRLVIAKLREQKKNVEVTALTGHAAVALGGSTLHRAAGIRTGSSPSDFFNGPRLKMSPLRTADVLVVDEVSMLSAILFHRIEHLARVLRRNGRPFGGIQLIFSGDFSQLEPIIDDPIITKTKIAADRQRANTAQRKVVNDFELDHDRYTAENRKYCFQADAWTQCFPVPNGVAILRHIYRQQGDATFATILENIRNNRTTQGDLDIINQRVGTVHPALDCIILDTRNDFVNTANDRKITALPGDFHHYHANVHINCVNEYHRALLVSMLDTILAPAELSLKIGARVICLANLTDTLCNGTQGTVHRFIDTEVKRRSNSTSPIQWYRLNSTTATATTPPPDMDHNETSIHVLLPEVKWDNGHVTVVEPHAFTVDIGRDSATRHQLPLKHGWAITIHKAQGMTIEKAIINLACTFAVGQAYCALSRVTGLNGLFLTNPVTPQHLKQDPKVTEFLKQIESNHGIPK